LRVQGSTDGSKGLPYPLKVVPKSSATKRVSPGGVNPFGLVAGSMMPEEEINVVEIRLE
jgi:hypothetical protein